MMLRSPRAGRRKMPGAEGVAGADLVIEEEAEEEEEEEAVGVAGAVGGEGSDKRIGRELSIE
jgi:hypothetical protein